ncbi:MAG: phosphomannomutase/phosphoglucomutase [Candidatus Pacebacteria bacterium]|nr:phosphomannomutase/phosphoglucomutase [Candidatus Paceibacterota bacterium]
MINPNIFRIYDIRGIYPKNLNEKIAFQIAFAFCKIYPNAKKVVVAWDSRLSSPLLAKSVIKALMFNNRQVINIGLAPDPLFSFCLAHYKFDAGIGITASHNPKNYNGLILNYKGMGVTKENLNKIKKLVLKDEHRGKTSTGGLTSKKKGILKFNPEKEYIDYVLKRVKLKKSLKIVFDCGNGAMGYLPERVFKKLGCQVQTIFGEPDGNFPNHLPDPYLEKNLKHIKKEVLKQKADVGFAFDGDGDRVALIDSKGRAVSGDSCILLLAKQVLKKYKGSIVSGVRVSNLFLNEIKKLGAKHYWSVSHHNALIEKIKKTKSIFGGEITSHCFFPKEYYLVDDALFTALKLAEIVSKYDDFSKYIDSLPKIYISKEIFIKAPDEEKLLIIEKLKKYLKEKKIKYVGVDGARIQYENGWALARASNTSPYIKIRFEGKTSKDLQDIKTRAIKIFKKVGIGI